VSSRVFVLAAAGLCALLAGCAPTHVPWTNPHVPQSQWADDWRTCRRDAEREVLGGRDMDAEDSRTDPLRDYDRDQAKRAIDGEVEACMREKGYFPVMTRD
jgi:hypothetical protein